MSTILRVVAQTDLCDQVRRVDFEAPFMPWVDYLPDGAGAIRQERAKLLDIAQQAAELERHALALRAQLASGQAALLTKVMRSCTLADLQLASEAANCADPTAVARAQVDDTALRERLHTVDGWHMAGEALQVFSEARLIRDQNILTTASDEDRRKTLARVLAWWDHVALPVCKRLALV